MLSKQLTFDYELVCKKAKEMHAYYMLVKEKSDEELNDKQIMLECWNAELISQSVYQRNKMSSWIILRSYC